MSTPRHNPEYQSNAINTCVCITARPGPANLCKNDQVIMPAATNFGRYASQTTIYQGSLYSYAVTRGSSGY